MKKDDLEALIDDLERHIELAESFDGENGPITIRIYELKALLEELK